MSSFPALYSVESASIANGKAKTIAVTGCTGYLAAVIVNRLLEIGHVVHGTARSTTSAAAQSLLQLPHADERLKLFAADLTIPGSFNEAFKGCEVVIHVASPFIQNVPKAQVMEKLVKPAVSGTENVLGAVDQTPSVKRVVLTSSTAAIYGSSLERGEGHLFTEEDWCIVPTPEILPYYYSKREAEKKAWELVKSGRGHWDLVVMNPGMIMGPPAIPRADGESIAIMKDIWSNTKMWPACPKIGLAFVDVRDVAAAHCIASFDTKAKGRHILSQASYDLADICKEVSQLFPGKVKAPIMKAPKWMLTLLGPLMGISSDTVKYLIGLPTPQFSNSKVTKELGLTFIPFSTTLKDMSLAMAKYKIINQNLEAKA